MNDPLAQAAGLSLATSEKDKKVLQGRLVETADQFLRGGGTLSLRDWALLTVESRAAFTVIGGRMSVEKAVLTGIAGQGLAAALGMYSAIDDGDLSQQTACEIIVQQMAAKAKPKPKRQRKGRK